MRVFFLQVAATGNHMNNHVPFQQWHIVLEVECQNWPRIGEGEVGGRGSVDFFFLAGCSRSLGYLFFLAQPNERLSIVGHLDTSATMIKKMPAAHAKHRTKHKQKPKQAKQPNTTKKRHVQ